MCAKNIIIALFMKFFASKFPYSREGKTHYFQYEGGGEYNFRCKTTPGTISMITKAANLLDVRVCAVHGILGHVGEELGEAGPLLALVRVQDCSCSRYRSNSLSLNSSRLKILMNRKQANIISQQLQISLTKIMSIYVYFQNIM